MKISITFILSLLWIASFAQNTQTVRGVIVDQDSRTTIPGATIVILDSDPIIGTTTDIGGRFTLEAIAVGRIDLTITSVGYEPRTLTNILVTSGKEVVLEVAMKESIEQMGAAEITADQDKKQTLNEMAIISARQFSVEETKRYAGSFNDPARMVSSYAGVASDAEGDNDIVVRGNSPKGILWRLEGVEIPNPNHFSDEGSTGGPINALNSSVLANSDFMTGAFEAEYGNATSGVFDMRLRTGNNEQREYSFSAGVIGTEFAAEGPIRRGSQASYLVNYRYSSLSMLDKAGIVDFGGIPIYQDAAFKVKVPTEKLGTFSLWGFGGLSNIVDNWTDSTETEVRNFRDDYRAHVGVVGLNNILLLNEKSFVKSNLVLSANGSGYSFEEDLEGEGWQPQTDVAFNKWNAKVDVAYNNKLNSRNRLKVGLIATSLNYSFISKYKGDLDVWQKELDSQGTSGFMQAYASWKHRLNETVTFVGGVHGLYFALNDTYSIEPRLAMNWQHSPNNIFSLGGGLHSKVESLLNYQGLVYDEFGNGTKANENLELPKAAHIVAGWDHAFSENTHLKTELYYQYLYDVPVSADPLSTQSMINSSGWFSNEAMVSEGIGQNIGIELTYERFLTRGLYYLVTASLFESRYQAQDEVWRKTRYNSNYLANVLVGKEFELKRKKEKDRTLAFNIRGSLLGGNRYTPVDLQASMLADEEIYGPSLSAKGDDVFFVNVGSTYRINRKKATHEVKFEVLNASNNQARVRENYNADDQKIEYDYQLGLIPNIVYTLTF